MNGFKTALRALMLLSLLIGVAACGDDDDTNAESDANAESTDSSDGQSADAPATEAEMIEVKGATFLTSQSSAPAGIEKIITALDVGSWKVCALIAGQTADGQLHVLGTGQRESRGVQRGYV